MSIAGKLQDTIVWLNGRYVSLRNAGISPLDRGFLYGDGLFETMRAEDGRVLMLAEHLARLLKGLASLRIELRDMAPGDWPRQIEGLLRKNLLRRGTASVKLVVSRGVVGGLGFPASECPTVLMTAERYEPPSREACLEGWRLHAVPAGLLHPLAVHKTASYLSFLAARQEALDAGADEAILVDPDGSVIEAAAGSLLALTGEGWSRPLHPFQLAGITVGAVTRLLEERGLRVASRRMPLSELEKSRALWVLNSLIGIMPASRVGMTEIPEKEAALAETLRGQLLSA